MHSHLNGLNDSVVLALCVWNTIGIHAAAVSTAAQHTTTNMPFACCPCAALVGHADAPSAVREAHEAAESSEQPDKGSKAPKAAKHLAVAGLALDLSAGK